MKRIVVAAVVLWGCQGEPVTATPVNDSAITADVEGETTADSTVDSSTDSAIDSAIDSSIDSAIDSSTDSRVDSSTDSGVDAPLADAPADAPGGSDPECGTHKAGAMVYSGAGTKFCIDAREVTRGQYAAFVAASDKKPQPAFCDWNKDYALPISGLSDDHPATNIDWCDAYEFCLWAGKHLCGAIADGAPLYSTAAADSQWAFACENGSGTVYSTGTEPSTDTCRVGSTLGPASVNEYPNCHGTKPPWTRVFNLSGNVREWDGAGCQTDRFKAGMDATYLSSVGCGTRGGHHGTSALSSQCQDPASLRINEKDGFTGFRCCKGPFT